MSHPDEGTIQALLDGELEPAERARVETHVGSCSACAARVAEARAFQLEADRLVEVLAVPSLPARARGASPGRRTVVRTLAWAASILLAVAVGYWGRGAEPGQAVVLQEGERPSGGRDAAAPMSPPASGSTPTAPPPATTTAPAPRAEAKSADQPVANAPRPALQPAERDLLDARANEVAAKAARQVDEPAAAWRVVSMEEGVRLLGGQIRLIDGLAPDRVETGPGTAVSGADPSLPLVRVIYASGSVTLDQQRPATQVAARRETAAEAATGATAGANVTAWQERGGIRYVITGSVPADSLRALGARVR